MPNIAIIGAGIGGLTTAIALRRYCPHLSIEIYERSPVLQEAGAGLALAANAMHAFNQLGLQQSVSDISRVLHQFKVLDKKGRLITATNNLAINKKLGTVSNFSVHRAALQQLLFNNLSGVPVHLGKQVVSFQQNEAGIALQFADGTSATADFVIAADGIHSVFRKQLLPQSQIRFAGYSCWRGITNSMPANMENNIATETWGDGKRFGLVQLKEGGVYWFACLNTATPKDPRFAAFTKTNLLNTFAGFHEPIAALIEMTDASRIIWNDIIDCKPVKQFAFGNILLLGDAAHATTPNMGQGACQAIEDAVVLGKTLQQQSDIPTAFQQFEQKRIRRTTKIVNQSWMLGKMAQSANPLFCFVRNKLLGLLPDSLKEKEVQKILAYEV